MVHISFLEEERVASAENVNKTSSGSNSKIGTQPVTDNNTVIVRTGGSKTRRGQGVNHVLLD